MSENIQRIGFENGIYALNIDSLNVSVKATKKLSDGDWKTQSVRSEFMGMNEGQEGEVIEIFNNFDGQWCRVKHDNGISDVSPTGLIVLKTNVA